MVTEDVTINGEDVFNDEESIEYSVTDGDNVNGGVVLDPRLLVSLIVEKVIPEEKEIMSVDTKVKCDRDVDGTEGKEVLTVEDINVFGKELIELSVNFVDRTDKVVGSGGEIVGVPVCRPAMCACLLTRLGSGLFVYTNQAITSNPISSVTRPTSMLCWRILVKSCTCSKKPHAKCHDNSTLSESDLITFPGPAVKMYFPLDLMFITSDSVLEINTTFRCLETKFDHLCVIVSSSAVVRLLSTCRSRLA